MHLVDEQTQPIQAVWKKYLRGKRKSRALLNELVLHYRPRAVLLAKLLHSKAPARAMYEDILSGALDGLMEAIRHYDKSCGASFETYSGRIIQGRMLDYLRDCDDQSRTIRQFEARREAAIEHYLQEFNRPPTPSEAAMWIGVPLTKYLERDQLSRTRKRSISTLPEGDELAFEEARYDDFLADTRERRPDQVLEAKDTRAYYTRGLNRVQRTTIVRYFFEAHTLKEIGEELGLSESRMSQVLGDTITYIRARLQAPRSTPHGKTTGKRNGHRPRSGRDGK